MAYEYKYEDEDYEKNFFNYIEETYHYHDYKKMSYKQVPMPIWRTQDGETIPISEMSDIHLVHAIKYLERMATEMAIKRGQQYGNIMRLTSVSFSKYIFLLEEARKRGIIKFVEEMTMSGDVDTFRVWVQHKPLHRTTKDQEQANAAKEQQDQQTQIEKKLGGAGHRKIIL